MNKEYHAIYMRKWRKAHALTQEQRRKMNCRCYTNVYIRRGLITREPCKSCGSIKVQPHHTDYSKPLLIIWLCKECHMQEHKRLTTISTTQGLTTLTTV